MHPTPLKSVIAVALTLSAILALGACGKKVETTTTTTPATTSSPPSTTTTTTPSGTTSTESTPGMANPASGLPADSSMPPASAAKP